MNDPRIFIFVATVRERSKKVGIVYDIPTSIDIAKQIIKNNPLKVT